MRKALAVGMAAILGMGTLALTTGSASAYVVCNNAGYCWHVHPHYGYPAGVGIVVHPDNWRWGTGVHYRWREHTGRGYWNGAGVWIGF